MSTASDSSDRMASLKEPPEASAPSEQPQDTTSSSSAAAATLRGSSKRPLLTHTKDGQQLSEKKLRRLEKNRLSARECRRRKREATENLERQINVLEGENLRLRLQLQIGEEAEESLRQEQSKLTRDMDALLKSGASEAEIFATIEEFKEKFADYGRDRRSSIEFHLRNIQRLLMPTQTTSVVMRAIKGGEHQQQQQSAPGEVGNAQPVVEAGVPSPDVSTPSVASAASMEPDVPPDPNNLEPKDLFRYLVNYLQVNPQQAAALKDSRFVAQEMDGCLETALQVLEELRSRLAQTGEDLEAEFNNVRNILTPTQAAKFLVWVANNSACIHMLNELWDRVYPADSSSNQQQLQTMTSDVQDTTSNAGESSG